MLMKASSRVLGTYQAAKRRAPHTIPVLDADVEPDMRVCTLCGATDHSAAGCPWNRSLRSLAEDLH